MSLRCYITIGFCFLFSSYIIAQPGKLDSLLKVNAGYKKEDTTKTDVLYQIAFLLQSTDPAKGFEYAAQAIAISKKINHKPGLAQAYYVMGVDYAAANNTAEALDFFQKAAGVFESVNNQNGIAKVYNAIGSTYLTLDEHYGDALLYFNKAIAICKTESNNALLPFPMLNKAIVYKNLDSTGQALQYFKEALVLCMKYAPERRSLLANIYSGLGSMYTEPTDDALAKSGFRGSRYDTSIYYQQKALAINAELGNESGVAVCYRRLADAFFAQKKYGAALSYVGKTKQIAHEDGFLGIESDAAGLLSKIYGATGRFDSAYLYQKEYAALEDSILNDDKEKALIQKEMQYNFSKKEDSLNFQNTLLSQTNAINKLRLRQQWFYSIGGILVLLCIGSFLFYRNRNKEAKLTLALGKERAEKKQKEAEFERRMSDAALNSLRSQMNPHFIFNCLNSIKLYALENKAEEATEYLGKFSGLMRLVLENSKTDRITLQKEIETLQLYLEMEVMRFKEKLSYEIQVADTVDKDYLELPPMLIQPYVENAIWHGLMPKEEGGKVTLHFTCLNDNCLEVVVSDNGVGRAKAAELKSKSAQAHKSFGMSITHQRIELMNQLYQTNMSVSVSNKHDERGTPTGTEIRIIIPID
jgi:tetratricopeptide (TPR) repeat protein